jgi:hypothetical protein
MHGYEREREREKPSTCRIAGVLAFHNTMCRYGRVWMRRHEMTKSIDEMTI